MRSRSNSAAGPAADVAPVAEHGDAVGEREDLVEAVRDEDRRDALLPQPPDEAEERLDLVVGERARRLVEDQDARVDRERASDLDHLLLIGSQAPHGQGRVEIETETLQSSLRPGVSSRRQSIMPPPLCHSVTEEDVLGDREFGREGRLLGHRRDALPQGVGRVSERSWPTVERDLRRHRLHLTGEDLEHGRLARAVLAHERVHLAGVDGRGCAPRSAWTPP